MAKLLKDTITLKLTIGSGENTRVPDRSGLNWGQRPNRDHNQAYIAIPREIQKSSFFPEAGVPFEIKCDDGYKMNCVRAQANGKALQTNPQNAILGAYFRRRLSLRDGQLITLAHLERYGRSTLEISKIDYLHFFLDFSAQT